VSAIVQSELAQEDARAVDVVQRALVRLHSELGGLIGASGFDVLGARSLVLARRAHPVLAQITAGSGGTLVGLEALGDAAAAEEAAISIVAHFIELLSVLIGEDLAVRLVCNVWPAAAEEENQ
jgi:hypothetical protein